MIRVNGLAVALFDCGRDKGEAATLDIDLRYRLAGKGDEHSGAAARRLHLQEIARTEIVHGDDDPERPAVAVADPIAALEAGLRRGDPIVVGGSLYLVGAIRARIVPEPEAGRSGA